MKKFTGLSLTGVLYELPEDKRIKMIIGVDPEFKLSKEEIIEVINNEFKGKLYINKNMLIDMTIVGEDLWSRK